MEHEESASRSGATLLWGAAIVLVAGAALALAGSGAATQTGDTYGGSGPWTINNPTTVDGEFLNISGNVVINSQLTVRASTFYMSNNTVITVRAPNGKLDMSGGLGRSAITTLNDTWYWTFVIESGAGGVALQNMTLDHMNNGIQVNGGTATTRYFADLTITHAKNYGIQLTDSSATLMHIYVGLDFAPLDTVQDSWTNYSYDYGSYIQSISYHYYYRYWSLTGVGVQATRGSPWIDGVEVHVPPVATRVDVQLPGSVYYSYDLSRTYCGAPFLKDYYNYTYQYGYFYEAVNFYGFRSVDSRFAYFNNVRPPTEDVLVDIHYTFTGPGYGYTYTNYPRCGQVMQYQDPNQVVYYNYIYYGYNPYANPSTANNMIGVYLQNGGLNNFDGLNYSMGKAGIVLSNDWGGAQPYKDYFQQYNLYLNAAPSVYALWSLETVTTSTFAAVTPTDFSLTNSYFTGAGIRVDRTYNYNTPSAPNGANDTTFRGVILVNNVTVLGAIATGIDIRLSSFASSTFNRFDYRAFVTNSTIAAGRTLRLAMPNYQGTSNYVGTVQIIGNTFRDGFFAPPAPSTSAALDLGGIIAVDLTGHPGTLLSDTFQASVLLQGNSFTNMTGPLIGVGYGYYRHSGGSSLTIESNTFKDISYYRLPQPGGGFTAGKITDAFIKTNMDAVYLRNNTITNLTYVNGIIGGPQGADPNVEYLAFSYCAQYGYISYGCNWPYKTPTIEVTGNAFEGILQDQGASQVSGFVLLTGRGYTQFQHNVVNNSTVTFIHAYLNDYSYYKFPVEDLNVLVEANTVTNQTSRPFGEYTYPYKTGMPYVMIDNSYSDSRSPFIIWRSGWYANIIGSPPTELGSTFVLSGNSFNRLSLGADAAAHLTGKMTITNNTFDGVQGWAVIADRMSKVPSISGNNVLNSTNGWWFAPAILSGLPSTATFQDLSIAVSDTGIRMENGNLVLLRVDFGDAATAVDMRNGYAEIYSSRIRVLSGRVQGDASIAVYNNLGYEVRWADASGTDSGVVVKNALIVTSTPDNEILVSGHTGADGRIAPKMIEVWVMTSFGSAIVTRVDLPLKILAFAGGISEVISLPQLAPGESPQFFEDYPAYPLLLVDPIIPEVSVGKPLSGEVVGHSNVLVQGYTFERGSGIATQRLRLDSGAWIDVAIDSATWSITLPGVSEGRHVLEIEAVDVATNAFRMETEFFVDVTPPLLTLKTPLDDYTLTNEPVFDIRGHVEPADSQVALNGITIGVGARGDFFYNATLSDGLNVLRFTATDAAGNMVVVVRQVEFDRYAPFLQVDEPVNGLLTNAHSVDVTGRAERGSIVTVNGLLAFVNPIDGSFVLPEVLLDDLFDQTENLLIIKAIDRAGNARFENRSVVVDTKAPTIDLELDEKIQAKIDANEPISSTSLAVNGRTNSRDAKITVAGQDVPLSGLSFSRTIVMHEGLNVIKITAKDSAGNERVKTLRVVRDTVRPTLTLETPSEPSILTNRSSVLITGFTDSPDATVYIVYDDDHQVHRTEPVLAVPVGLPIQYRFEYTLSLVTDGNEHIVQVRATDLAENFDAKEFAYTAKVNAPFLEISGFKTSTTETFVWINGTTELGVEKVRINGQEFDVSGQFFAVRWNLPIQEGNYTFTVSVRDQAGNQAQYVNRVEVHATATAPTTQTTPGVFSNPTLQVGIGAGLFGIALGVLAFAMARRRVRD